MSDQAAAGTTSSLTPTHGVLTVLLSSAAVLAILMGMGFRPRKSSK
jgi:hypothetical protein